MTNAIEYQWEILLDTSRSGADRATALRYLIHFVGDMHQPLHASDNDDEGGNCTAMKFFDQERPANLHSIWDTLLIQHELALERNGRRLRPATRQPFYDKWPLWGTAPVDPTAWAWESNGWPREFTYGDLKPAIPVEKPGSRRTPKPPAMRSATRFPPFTSRSPTPTSTKQSRSWVNNLPEPGTGSQICSTGPSESVH